ncbi:hypothetical protein [Achromobacter pulmonis]|uniref:hypothetical protein n=1 Tax=Achromobacter pulmonis TaxID=1389932 RepID=UPI001F2E2902|nr:hypothetical protein [Achromobacter pulmonis]MCF7771231.1 hypothetical protein [Achromobacter pulmonis]
MNKIQALFASGRAILRLNKRVAKSAYLATVVGPPLSTLQIVVAMLALFWVLPILIIMTLTWGPVSSWMGVDGRASWAGAVGSIAAAWAAVWGVLYPQYVRRREERIEGATEAMATENLVVKIKGGVDETASVVELRFSEYEKALANRNSAISQIMSTALSNLASKVSREKFSEFLKLGIDTAMRMAPKSTDADREKATLSMAQEKVEKAESEVAKTASEIQSFRLAIENIPAQTIRRYDIKLAITLYQARNLLHAAEQHATHPGKVKETSETLKKVSPLLEVYIDRAKSAGKFLQAEKLS